MRYLEHYQCILWSVRILLGNCTNIVKPSKTMSNIFFHVRLNQYFRPKNPNSKNQRKSLWNSVSQRVWANRKNFILTFDTNFFPDFSTCVLKNWEKPRWHRNMWRYFLKKDSRKEIIMRHLANFSQQWCLVCQKIKTTYYLGWKGIWRKKEGFLTNQGGNWFLSLFL